MVSFMQTAIDTSAHDSPSVIQRKLKDSINRSINDDFWNELRNYLDRKHNGIISNIERNPSISKKDSRFIELMCCGFSYVEIAATLNLHPQYISQKRRMIAKKLNLTVDMQDYLNSMMDS